MTLARLAVPLALFIAGCAHTQTGAPWPLATTPEFCAGVQRVLAGTDVPAETVSYESFDAFVKSKASVRPLVTRQLVTPEMPGGGPMMISCKVKSADHIDAEYGPGSAGGERSCQAVNALILEAVLAALGDDPRVRQTFAAHGEIVLEPDEATLMGPRWLQPYPMVARGPGGALHIRAKGLLAEWTDPRFVAAPPQFRGNHYCHLVAPEYLARVLTGAVPVD